MDYSLLSNLFRPKREVRAVIFDQREDTDPFPAAASLFDRRLKRILSPGQPCFPVKLGAPRNLPLLKSFPENIGSL